jgi:MoxR-like ATPase
MTAESLDHSAGAGANSPEPPEPATVRGPSAFPADETTTTRLAAAARGLVDALDRHVVGQREAIETLVAAYMAGGHALLEGLPGMGKTRLARGFASCLGVRFGRVQFTPDLMPADLLGTNIFDTGAAAFRLLHGPIFTEVLMADEINRTPPKTQSALLEAMQERQVTIDGESLPLDAGFFVIATQNPIELEGVYPLPEAQLDRFLVRIEMGLPPREAELGLLRRAVAGSLDESGLGPPLLGPGEALALRHAAQRVHAAEDVLDYLVRLASAARRSPHVELGVSPRAVLALLQLARGAALLEGREFVAPDDVKSLLVPCWAHRMILTPEAELEGHSARRLLEQVAAAEPVPH